MADDNKNNDNENEFEEEFDFESDDPLEDVSLESSEVSIDEEANENDSDEALEENKADESPVSKPQGKSNIIPSLIGLAILGFVGYQLYNFFGFGGENVDSSSQQAELKESTSSTSKEQTSLSLDSPSNTSTPSLNDSGADVSDADVSDESKMSTTTPDMLEAQITPKSTKEPEGTRSNIPSWQEKTKTAAPNEPEKNTSSLALESTSQPPRRDTEAIEKIEKKLNSLQEAHQKQIGQIERSLTQTTQNTNNLNKGVQALQQQISTLSQSVNQLSQKINEISLESQKPPASQKAKTPAPSRETKPVKRVDSNPKYTVYAIIPGRAWLRSTSGKTLTVSEGDQVGDYGKVLKIDPSNGIVVTSSGVTLR